MLVKPYKGGWPAERQHKLLKLVKQDGLSATQIGRELGVSRGAVIGFCNRNDIDLPNKGKLIVPNNKGRKHVRPTRVIVRNKRATPPQEVNMLPLPENCEPVEFWQLEHGQCKFCVEPHDTPASYDMKCCGAEVMDRDEGGMRSSFCEYHYGASTEVWERK